MGAANLCAKILDLGGFDSSIIFILRGGIPRPIGNFPDILSPQILVGRFIVARLGVLRTAVSRTAVRIHAVRIRTSEGFCLKHVLKFTGWNSSVLREHLRSLPSEIPGLRTLSPRIDDNYKKHTYTPIHTYMYTSIHIYIYIHVYIYIYIYMYLHMYISTYVHIYRYTCIETIKP